MNTQQVLADLRLERDRINQAIAALELLDGQTSQGYSGVTRSSAPGAGRKSGRYLSPEGRARIAAAARARWAKQRAAKATGKATGPSRRISAAGRKAISEAAKRRWAAHRMNAGQTAKKVAAKTETGARTMSSAARKRIAEAMKKRWAERRKAKVA